MCTCLVINNYWLTGWIRTNVNYKYNDWNKMLTGLNENTIHDICNSKTKNIITPPLKVIINTIS